MIDRALLARLLEEYPFQPATALWRAVEIAVLADQPVPAGRGLDLGCGDGRLTRLLLDSWGLRTLVGVDIDPAETALAQSERIYQRVHTCPADAIPENSSSFSFAFANSVLEHIPDLHPVLAELARLLAPGGLLLLTVPGPGFHSVLRGPLLPWKKRQEYLQSLDRRLAHYRYLTAAEWRSALEAAGLTLVLARPYLNAKEVRRWEAVSGATAGILSSAFSLLRRAKQPIEIQRALGMRRAGLRLPTRIARPIARLLAVRLDGVAEPQGERDAGCLLIAGVKGSARPAESIP